MKAKKVVINSNQINAYNCINEHDDDDLEKHLHTNTYLIDVEKVFD